MLGSEFGYLGWQVAEVEERQITGSRDWRRQITGSRDWRRQITGSRDWRREDE
ncbi:hypothetical protein PM082_002453 [Marasmius tenuissimus]|nr:hypothetical protein PM082_002453 [Marasmius tenuissimus]